MTTLTFNYTTAYQIWNVPSGVTSVAFEVAGGSGSGGEFGGKGANVTGILNTSNITQLFIYVGGGNAITNVRWNGGGKSSLRDITSSSHGGDASDIRIGNRTLNDRIVVAGGGGGYGQRTETIMNPLGQSTVTIVNITGGYGGYPNGETMGTSGGGTQISGGVNTSSSLQNGSFGNGGSYSGSNGGGGGWYGGAGSVSSSTSGGGGSSYTNPSYVSSVTHQNGVNTGNGYVKLTWVASLHPRVLGGSQP